MKQAVAAFALFVVIVGCLTLFLTESINKSVAQEQSLVCKGKDACLQGSLNVYTKENVASSSAMPANTGYCLLVPVLLYHHVQPEADAVAKGQTSLTVDNGYFDLQMQYLASHGYTTISAQQLVNAIISHGTVPPKSVVVTFDDGYLDVYLYAYPILQKYHQIGNLMIPTGLLGTQVATNTYYTSDELKEMVASGSMFAYNHTVTHYPLGEGPKARDVQEINTAQDQLKSWLGNVSPIFVYPYGSGQNMPWVFSLLKDNGFVAAFSTLPGVYQCEGNLYALPRIHVGNAPLSAYGL